MWQRHNLLTKGERLLTLTEEQMRLLEHFSPEFRERHIEAPHTGSLRAVDTFFVGTLKGRIRGKLACPARRRPYLLRHDPTCHLPVLQDLARDHPHRDDDVCALPAVAA